MIRSSDRPAMTIAIDLGRKATKQTNNAVKPVRLKPATPQSRVKYSTTEPLRLFYFNNRWDAIIDL